MSKTKKIIDYGNGVIEEQYNTGEKRWIKNGKYHREDGPAIEYVNGTKKWLINGYLHREDGPAIINSNGTKYWYLNGKELSESEISNLELKIELQNKLHSNNEKSKKLKI